MQIMLTVRTAAVLAMIAGSVAPMTVSARGEPRGGSTFTCSISAWVWEGVISDEFLLSSNWFDCGVFNGPTPDLPIYFGPVEQFINGVSQGCVFPAGPAVLQSDFTSMRTLTMTSIGSPMLTVSGAFYTGSGTIGTAAQNDCGGAPGTATLVLDNAVWDGNITLGAGSGTCGELILRGHSMVTGSIMTSSGTAKFVNDGFFTFDNDSTFSSSTQGSTWTNTPGSTLVLANTSSSSYPFNGSGNGNTVVNQAGATILKDGSDASNFFDWDYDGQGLLRVETGTLRFTSNRMLADRLNASVAAAGEISFSDVDFVGDGSRYVVDSIGEGRLTFSTINGPADLVFQGETRPEFGGTLSTDILNEGVVEVGNTVFSTSTQGVTWTNTPGSTLVLANTSSSSYPFNGSGNGNTVVNQAGATILKDGSDASNFFDWDYDGQGLLRVETGTLRFTSNRMLADRLNASVAAAGEISFSDVDFVGDGSRYVVDSIGEGRLTFSTINGPADLVFQGETRPEFGGTLSTDILNEGVVEVGNTVFSTSTQGVTWTNTPGSTLVLANTSSSSYPFGGTGNGNTVVNQAGATILKDGSGSNNIVDWMLINQGTVAVEQGTLTINAGFECGGIIDVGEGAVLRVLEPDPELKSITSTITGAGTFELNSAPALFTRGEISPSPRDPVANPAGLTIDVPAIYNDQTSVFRTQIGSLAGRLTCTGVYEVAGDIDIQRFGDFEPDGSEAFVVIEADFVSGVFGDYFENAEPLPGSDTAFDVRTGDLEYDLTYTPTQVIVSNVSIFVPPCNPADLAEPGGLLDLADVIAFSTAFSAGDGAADIAEPFGLLDLADVTSFIGFFLAGCP